MAPREKQVEFPKIAAAQTGPGPGAYTLPPLIGPSTAPNRKGAPQWSIKLPHQHHYNNAPAPNYKPPDNHLPAVSLKGRNFYRPKKLITPGPNAYSTKSVKDQNYASAPSFSMGRRTRYRSSDKVPPSTRYTLPNLVGGKNMVSKSAPTFGMSFVKPDHTSYSFDATKGPGPAAYNTGESTRGKRQPQYSLASRFQVPKDKTQKPGPGSYNLDPNFGGKQKKAPSFSMGSRHSQFVLPLITPADAC